MIQPSPSILDDDPQEQPATHSQSLLTPAAAPAPPPTASPATTYRPFGDSQATRQRIFDNVLKAAQSIEPVTNPRYQLSVEEPRWQGPESYSIADQKKALLSRGSLARKLTGTVRLRDPQGNVVSEKNTQLARVPYMTDRGTFIMGGNEYTLAHQMRLRPGIFTRRKENGELESHVNVSKGFGHRIHLDPESGIFRIQMGQAKIPLMPLLKSMGVSDSEIRETWGNELTAVNMKKNDPTAVKKLYKKLFRNDDATEEEQKQSIAEAFQNMELDPEVTKRTLGQGFSNVGPETLMAVTKKLLDVSRGEDEPDDRDALTYQTLHGPEDLFSERIRKAKTVPRQMLWKATPRGTLDNMGSNPYQDSIKNTLIGSGLGIPIEEVNPAEIFDQQVRVTRMGEGGIPCHSADTDVFTINGWKPWPEITREDQLACVVNGEMVFRHPTAVFATPFTGDLLVGQNQYINYAVTPCHRMDVRLHTTVGGKPSYSPDYRVLTAAEVHEKRVKHCTGGIRYSGGSNPPTFWVPPAPVEGCNRGAANSDGVTVDFRDWVGFLAAYLADGSFTYNLLRREYRVEIGKRRTKNPQEYAEICSLLDNLGFSWRYEQDRRFVISGKHIAAYVRRFGKAADKYVPDYIMFASASMREYFLSRITMFDNSGTTETRQKYASASRQLRDQVGQLAILAGKSVTYKGILRPGQNPQYQVIIREATEAGICLQKRRDQYEILPYDDVVYCASVPGSRLLTRREGRVFWSGNSMDAVPDEARAVQPSQFGFIDFLRTPESGKVGVDARMARAAVKGDDGNIYTPVVTKEGKREYKSPQEIADATVAFPNSLKSTEKYVPALSKGKVRMVPRDSVDFEIPDMESTFSPLGNMIPLKSMVKGQRAVMAARMLTQALPLRGAEAPLVQSGIPGVEGKSFEEEYAKHMGALKAPQAGRVMNVTDDTIEVKYKDGSKSSLPLYHNFPFNRKTFLHQQPTVQPGDTFEEGGLLARSNYTDERGATALGRNARVAYIPWDGLNFEDANIISESFANKMASEHMYQNAHEWDKKDHKGKNAFISMFPSKYDKKTLENFDKSGVIKPGTKVKEDDPLILIGRERERNKKSLVRGGKPSYQDVSQTWDHKHEGVVTDVVQDDKGVSVVVKTTSPMQVGDKLSGRYGDKGIISRVVPDDDMPQDSQGQPFEVLLNPLGITSRTNPAQIVEAALGKVAAKRGEPFKVPDFQDEDDLVEFAIKKLKEYDVQDTETISDPRNERKVNDVFTGNRWFMKLHHTAEGKSQGRGLGSYTAEGTPAKGGKEGAKRVGMLETNALLSHGATEVIREGRLVRGQSAPQYWSQYMSGFKPPTPEVPHVYKKFVNGLKASGINVVRDGEQMHVMALTDKDIDRMAGDREIKNAQTVNWKNMAPIKGGLFDEELTGGHQSASGGGNRWSYIKLHEPLPNPVMEEPIRRVLGLTKKQLNDVIAGKHEIQGKTGPKAIATALKNMDLDKEIEQARADIDSGKKTYRDKAVRKLGYLKSAKRLGIDPSEWVLSKAPVLPPAFRPVSTMGPKKLPLVADPNYLYKELWDANDTLTKMADQLDEEDLGEERLNVYDAFKAVTGLGDPTHKKNQERKVKGILKHIFGNSPKLGTVQRRLLGATTDMVGRAVISPDPDLDMDQVGVPEDKAWTIYEPMLRRRLVRRGMPRTEAKRAVAERSSAARKDLLDEMENGVILINRAPTLHRYGVMAARPRLTKGDVLKISPLVVGGFGADFDGDAMNYLVPTTEEAQQEAAEKMLPSRNLFSAANFGVHYTPSQEYIGGLYEASAGKDVKNKPAVFATTRDALRAYMQGRIGLGRQVEILDT